VTLSSYTNVLRIAAWLSVLTIGILSLVPGDLRPTTSAPSQLEHAVAYFAAAALLWLAYSDRRRQVLIGIGLTIYA
jgi:hypothetical protein